MLTGNGIKISSPPQDSSAQKVSMPEGEYLVPDTSVPAMPDEVIDWMISDARSKHNEQYAESVEQTIVNNLMQRYFPMIYKKLKEMKEECQPKTDINIAEVVLQKMVESEIQNVAKGGIGVSKNFNKE